MKKALLSLILCLIAAYSGYAQIQNNRSGRYFIQLQDGRVIYADKIQYKSPIFKSSYFLLDDSLKFNPSTVNVFQDDEGFFARVSYGNSPDAFAKRIMDGPRIDRFYTSRTSYDYSPYGYGYGGYSPYGFGGPRTSRKRIYFFSKDNGPLYQVEYETLREALADNASSMALLGKYRKEKLINTGVSVLGAGLLAAGAIVSVNNSQEVGNGGNLNVSPLVYAGAGVLGAQFVINLFQKDKLTQAIEVYNYQLKQ
ncbi:hypothetical protein CLV24_103163 [Pontibacter ummariensis]|uniref:Uncharacterized protein n=1 Tax=Pontibacter ummariensis TaxID=1610492 RepID=A0A239CNE9_9BACT|nr:hypothetical protein [Pontibacter ummariensis]PRY14924.1 hypothetical protein CLV24_103163 [Pontibacter ummariensis]SNS21469.1 hypothetical protein SAMN06296052_103150 [Pontibacter ummariensis]